MDRLEVIKSIVVTSIEQGYVYKGKTNAETAANIAEFYKVIYKTVLNTNS